MTVPVLHVCVSCRPGATVDDGTPTPGRLLHDAVAAHPDAAAVELREVVCLASCDHGCAAAIAMPGKWRYLLGRLAAPLAGDLLDYAARYAEHPRGVVLPSKRPASLSRMILGRMPA